jgi:hypothetical protein
MLKFTLVASLACALSLSISNAEAEVHPDYCVELLTHAGYTITAPVAVTEAGILHVTTSDGELFLGQSTLGDETWEHLRLLRTRAIEVHLAEKESTVYVIGQIDMYSDEPYCGRYPIS